MPFIPVPNGVMAIIKQHADGIAVINTLSFEWVGTGSLALSDLQALGAALHTFLHTELAVFQCNDLGYDSIDVVDQAVNPGMIATEILGFDGTLSSAPVPNQVSMSVSFQSGLTGRSNRGRYYICSLPQSAVNDPIVWKASEVTNIDAAFANLPAAVAGLNFLHSVISRFHNGSPRTTGVTVPVISYRANAGITTQRRRLT